jgi:hypothetical protein
MTKLNSVFIIFGFYFLSLNQVTAQTASCVTGGTGGALSPSGLYMQGENECLLASDINALTSQGYSVDPNAGAKYNMPPLASLVDAAEFSKRCMSEKGVFDKSGTHYGTDPESRALYESELARCNTLLFGQEFLVYRVSFYVGRFTKSQMDLINQAINFKNGCISMLDYKIKSPTGELVGGHAVALEGVSQHNKNDFAFDISDPNDPDGAVNLPTQHSNNSIEIKIDDKYRKMMGFDPKDSLELNGVTLKCPIEKINYITLLREIGGDSQD